MNDGVIKDLALNAFKVLFLVSSPMLLGALFIGILVSLFQAVTQINEQTLTFIPKMAVVFAALAILSPWIADQMVTFTRELILDIPTLLAGK